LSSGLEDQFEQDIKVFCENLDQEIKVIQHYGGGSGLLKSEVNIAFSQPEKTKNVLHKADSRGKRRMNGWSVKKLLALVTITILTEFNLVL
jgi:hypothetical protein